MKAKCKVGGCGEIAKSLGMCKSHYAKTNPSPNLGMARWHKPVVDDGAPTCGIQGCFREISASGICRMHINRINKYGTPDTPLEKKFPLNLVGMDIDLTVLEDENFHSKCLVCGGKSKVFGYCLGHYVKAFGYYHGISPAGEKVDNEKIADDPRRYAFKRVGHCKEIVVTIEPRDLPKRAGGTT